MTNRLPILAALGGTVLILTGATPARAEKLKDRVDPYELQLLVDGEPAPTFVHAGETYVLGRLGERYVLRIVNHSPRRVEVVAAVDGRDVVDGAPADYRSKRGYIVPAWGSVTIDGWRVSRGEAAAFRFSTVAASYAARTGSARDVGVVGVAVFPERPVPIARLPRPLAQPRAQGERAPEREDDARDDPSAGAKAERNEARPRPGLGTEYGEAVSSPIVEVEFVRERPERPHALLGVRYDDAPGLRAMGVDLECRRPADPELRRSADPFPGERSFAPPPAGWEGGRRPW